MMRSITIALDGQFRHSDGRCRHGCGGIEGTPKTRSAGRRRPERDWASTPDQPDDGGGGDTSSGASAEAVVQADPIWFAVALMLLIVGIWVGDSFYAPESTSGVTFTPNPAFSDFALLYILAQSLERVAELVTYIPWVGMRIGARIKKNGNLSVTRKDKQPRQ